MTYEHEIRVYERGGVCVVDEFSLAYLYYSSKIAPIIQPSSPLRFDLSRNNAFVYKTYPHIQVVYPQINRGGKLLCTSHTLVCPTWSHLFHNSFMVVENSVPAVY